MSTHRGHLVVFEGIDGCGKTTVSQQVAQAAGDTAVWTREPGDTPLGQRLRDLLLDTDMEIDNRAEALLMLADRAQHVAQMIRPALQQGQWVICDRFTHSTVAYQGYGRSLEPRELYQMSQWATGDLQPDLVLWLEVDFHVAQQRRAQSGKPDRIEQAGPAFQMMVHRGFKIMSGTDPQRWAIIDANQPLNQVIQASIDQIQQRVGWPSAREQARA